MLNKIERIWLLNRKIQFLKYSRDKIERIQLQKLKALIQHAYKTVPYYRDMFRNHNLKPEDINSLKDIKKIPLTSKQDLLSLDVDRITSDIIPSSTRSILQTSGSTGEPFEFTSDDAYDGRVGLNCFRSKINHGMKLTDKLARVGGYKSVTTPPGSLLKYFFFNRISLSSKKSMDEILQHLNQYQPNVIRGQISQLYVFSLWLEENDLRLTCPPKFVLCSAEMAHAFMTDKVAEILQTRIIDRYATAELGVVADTCITGEGYHVYDDSVYAEFLKLNGATYFVGTNLENFATPFIRYNTYDICEPSSTLHQTCSCGSSMTTFKRILGRDNDFILKPDQSLLAPMDLIFFMKKRYQFIKKYRVTQEDRKTLRVDIVPSIYFDNEIKEQLTSELNILSGGLQTTVKILDEIPFEKSGKLRIVKSYVKNKYSHAN